MGGLGATVGAPHILGVICDHLYAFPRLKPLHNSKSIIYPIYLAAYETAPRLYSVYLLNNGETSLGYAT